MADLPRLKEDLLQAARVADPTERLLEAAAIIAEALADLGVQPVVVGGLALAYWTDGEIQTGDIDVVMPLSAEARERLAALGLVRTGREWVLPGYEVAFEAPGDVLASGDRGDWIELESGRRVLVLSLEDMLLWRLREWVYWHHASGFHQAAYLLVTDTLDTERLEARAREEGLALALSELQRLVAEVEAGRVLEEWELGEIGQTIEEQSTQRPNDES